MIKSIILCVVISFTSCQKLVRFQKEVKGYVIEVQFELEDVSEGDAIKITTHEIPGDYTIYHDLKVGVNKVTYTINEKKGLVGLDKIDKDGKTSHLDDLYFSSESIPK